MELICHTELRMVNEPNRGKRALTFGVIYPVTHETSSYYEVIDDLGKEHTFTKNPDEEGKSYQDWLNVLQDDEEEEEE